MFTGIQNKYLSALLWFLGSAIFSSKQFVRKYVPMHYRQLTCKYNIIILMNNNEELFTNFMISQNAMTTNDLLFE